MDKTPAFIASNTMTLCAAAFAAMLAAAPAQAQRNTSDTGSNTAATATDSANPASAPASMAQLPAVRTSGKVKYLTGGVGKDESGMIKAEARHWPLALEFAVRTAGRAQFAADVDVLVRDAAGHEVLRAKAEGPFLLARLEPGQYTVQATLNGQVQNKPVHIEKDRPLRLLISWPPGNGQAPE